MNWSRGGYFGEIFGKTDFSTRSTKILRNDSLGRIIQVYPYYESYRSTLFFYGLLEIQVYADIAVNGKCDKVLSNRKQIAPNFMND